MGFSYGPTTTTTGLQLCLDVASPKSYSPNVFGTPLDLVGFFGTSANAATITRDSTVTDSPTSGVPLKMAVSGNDPYIASYGSSTYNIAAASVGQTWTVSVWVKASTISTVEGPAIFEANSSGTNIAGSSAGSVNVSTSWTRISFTYTFTQATAAYIQVRLDGPNTGGTGINYWWDGLQLERGSSATTFNYRTNTNSTSLYDLSSNNNNATLISNPTYSTSYSGTLSFNGTTQAINIPNSTSLQVADTFTISAWIYATDLSNRYGIFSTRLTNPAGSWQLEIGTGSGGTGRIAVSGVSTWLWESANSVVTTNQWYNVCFVKPSNSTVGGIMYLNGISLTPLATQAYTISNNSDPKMVGNGSSSSQWFPGNISNVTLYNVALSAADALQNYNALKSRFGL